MKFSITHFLAFVMLILIAVPAPVSAVADLIFRDTFAAPTPPEPAPSQCNISTPNLDCDLLGYWRFEEPVYFGRKHGVLDSSLTGHHATPINAVHYTTSGKLGKSLAFDGTSEYLTANHESLGIVPAGSFALWVKTSVNSHPDNYQSLIQSGSDKQVKLDMDESGKIRFTLDTANSTYTLYSSAGKNNGKWHHAVATWGENGLRLYVDGQQVASNLSTAFRPMTPEVWYLGATNGGQNGLFKGNLDEAAVWRRPLTAAEVQNLYNSGNGRVISMGPSIDEFQTRKAIYEPAELVKFDLEIDSEKSYSNVNIEVSVERQVDAKIQVYSQTHQIVQGSQDITIDWPLSGNGQDNNVQGHLARVTLRDSGGQVIAEKEALFDVVDNWWQVMRLALQSGGAVASPGAPSPISRRSDSTILSGVKGMRRWGFNTFEIYNFSRPWILDPESNNWTYMDYPDRLINKDRVAQWGTALHSQGMKYLAYTEAAAVKGSSSWQLRKKSDGSIYRKYYADEGYFTPNLNFLSQPFAEQTTAGIDTFGFDGVLLDSLYNVSVTTVKYYNDNNGNPMSQYPSVGQYLHDWLAPAKATIRAAKESFAIVSQNAYPLAYDALEVPLDDVYDTVLFEANKQDVWPFNEEVDMWSIEWDSANSPSENYPQEYERMAVILTSLADILGKPILQWSFLTSSSKTDIAYIRPKMATYLAARLKVHDHQNFYFGVMHEDSQDEPDSLQFAQYLRFQARYSYYLDHPDLKLIQKPQNTHFSLSASEDLFWNRTVYHRVDNGKDEYVINALNLPSNGRIEGQTEVPPTAENVTLKVRKSLGNFDVYCLDADDATLVPIEVNISSQDASYRYFSLPPVRSWQVLVLKEK